MNNKLLFLIYLSNSESSFSLYVYIIFTDIFQTLHPFQTTT